MFSILVGSILSFGKVVFSQPVKALAIILSICDSKAAIDHTSLADVLINSKTSVHNILKQCSYNRTVFYPTIFKSTVEIPCPVPPYACDPEEWATRADNALRTYVSNIDDYIYKIYILPYDRCSFAGLGVLGPCDKFKKCRIWINGAYAKYPAAYLHEIGHNLGVGHAWYNGNEYGDLSCIMGYCCAERCFNAPHAEMLGYTLAKLVYNLPLESSITTVLTQNEYIKIRDNENFKTYFVQSRQNIGLDYPPKGFGNSVNVYSIVMQMNTNVTNLEIVINNVNGEYNIDDRFIVVLHNIFDGKATITLRN
jgi:hypothetical protein